MTDDDDLTDRLNALETEFGLGDCDDPDRALTHAEKAVLEGSDIEIVGWTRTPTRRALLRALMRASDSASE